MRIEIEQDHITIFNNQGYEVVHWIEDEWIEDPTIILAIANAIKMAYTKPGELIEINKKHIQSQIENEKSL